MYLYMMNGVNVNEAHTPTCDINLLGLLPAVLEDGRHLLLPALGPLSAPRIRIRIVMSFTLKAD